MNYTISFPLNRRLLFTYTTQKERRKTFDQRFRHLRERLKRKIIHLDSLGAGKGHPFCVDVLILAVVDDADVGALLLEESDEIVHVTLYEHDQLCVRPIDHKCEIRTSQTYKQEHTCYTVNPLRYNDESKMVSSSTNQMHNS